LRVETSSGDSGKKRGNLKAHHQEGNAAAEKRPGTRGGGRVNLPVTSSWGGKKLLGQGCSDNVSSGEKGRLSYLKI